MKVNKLYIGDCVSLMSGATALKGTVDLVCVDPPYNIGYDYGDGEYDDARPGAEYKQWTDGWLDAVYAILSEHGAMWVVIGDEWAAEVKVAATQRGFKLRSWVVWYYTFGVNCTQKFNRSHAHLLYFVKDEKKFTFNVDAIRVPSARALVYNDKRAAPGGKLPDDTWVLRPQDLASGFNPEDDVWSISRVCGTFKERVAGAANQLPEQLMGRIIRACSNEGDLVLDPMSGTGTTLTTAKKLGRKYIGFEISPVFAERAANRLAGVTRGDDLD